MKLVRDRCVYIGPLCPVLNKAHGQVEISFLSLLTTTRPQNKDESPALVVQHWDVTACKNLPILRQTLIEIYKAIITVECGTCGLVWVMTVFTWFTNSSDLLSFHHFYHYYLIIMTYISLEKWRTFYESLPAGIIRRRGKKTNSWSVEIYLV